MMRTLWPALLASTVLISGSGPQDAAAASFSKEQLEQMVGPIALYADSLVSAVLTGATYPLEVVEADRWLDSNKDKKDDALQTALKEQTWDPSIKSLVMVPEVLKRMSANLDWTRDLGDAFLGQKTELMAAVQSMRKKANEAGNLKTSEQQQVTVEQDQTIVIDSTNPEVVYVPEYGTSVYGSGYSYPEPYYGNMYQSGWGLIELRRRHGRGRSALGRLQLGPGRRRHRRQPVQQLQQQGQQQLEQRQRQELEPQRRASRRSGIQEQRRCEEVRRRRRPGQPGGERPRAREGAIAATWEQAGCGWRGRRRASGRRR